MPTWTWPATRDATSGTRATLEEMLLARASVTSKGTIADSSELIKQAVAKEANAIGYDSIGFVDKTVTAVSIDGVQANAKSVLSGSYLMGRQLYVMSKSKPTGLSAKFIDYLRSPECQKEIVAKEGYIGLK